MKMRTTILCLGVLLLAGCGKEDVHTACYKNGDHGNMSDGRIIRVCDCVTNSLQKGNITAKESEWAIAWFNGKPPVINGSKEQEESAKFLTELAGLKTRCLITK